MPTGTAGYERKMDDQYNPPGAEEHPRFAVIAKRMARFTGSGWAVVTTVAALAVWVVAGFLADFSRTWELIMIAGLPVVMLLLLIVVQHTQNHDNLAMQLKLDELIRAHERTEDEMMRVEDASYEHLEDLERDFKSHVERETDRPSASRAEDSRRGTAPGNHAGEPRRGTMPGRRAEVAAAENREGRSGPSRSRGPA